MGKEMEMLEAVGITEELRMVEEIKMAEELRMVEVLVMVEEIKMVEVVWMEEEKQNEILNLVELPHKHPSFLLKILILSILCVLLVIQIFTKKSEMEY